MGQQATAATNALDFSAANEALSQAFAAAEVVRGGEAVSTVADTIAKRADHLIGVPARSPAQVARKVEAFGWLEGHFAGPLTPERIRTVAGSQSEAAKRLLAIYLDLTASPVIATTEERGSGPDLSAALYSAGALRTPRAAWEAALANFEAAAAERDRLSALEDGNGEDVSEEWEAADEATAEALTDLLNTRAPDALAMGVKARLVIERAHLFYRGDSVADAGFISRLLNGDWSETGFAAIYQDGLALAGIGGPVVEAKPDDFEPGEWLDAAEGETGSRMVRSDSHSPRVHFEGGDAAAATVRLEALHPAHREEVENVAFNRIRREAYAAAGPAPERCPATPEELQATMARALVNATPEAGRERLTAALASCGITPIVWADEQGQAAQ